MLSEFRVDVVWPRGGVPDDQLGSEVRNAAILRGAYEVFADLPELIGYAPWCLADFRVAVCTGWVVQSRQGGVPVTEILDETLSTEASGI